MFDIGIHQVISAEGLVHSTYNYANNVCMCLCFVFSLILCKHIFMNVAMCVLYINHVYAVMWSTCHFMCQWENYLQDRHR